MNFLKVIGMSLLGLTSIAVALVSLIIFLNEGFTFIDLVAVVICFLHFSRNYVSMDYYQNAKQLNVDEDKPIKIRR